MQSNFEKRLRNKILILESFFGPTKDIDNILRCQIDQAIRSESIRIDNVVKKIGFRRKNNKQIQMARHSMADSL